MRRGGARAACAHAAQQAHRARRRPVPTRSRWGATGPRPNRMWQTWRARVRRRCRGRSASTENGTSTYDPGSVSVSVPRYSAKPPRRTVTGTAASRSLFPCASTGTAHNRCGILGTSHQVAGFVCRRSSQKRTVTLTVSPGCGRVVESCTPNGGVFAHAGPAAARASTVPTTRTLSATTDRRIKASLRRTLLLHRPARDGSPRRTLRLRVRDREAGDLADQDALARCVHRDDHVLERRDQCLAVTRHGAPDIVRRRVDDLSYRPQRSPRLGDDLAAHELVIPPRAVGKLRGR